MGIAMHNIMIEKSQAMAWLEQLDEWKRNNQN